MSISLSSSRSWYLGLAVTSVFVLSSCGGGGDEDSSVPPLPSTPLGLKKVKLNVPAGNPMSAAKAHLGKQLFFDKRLSSNGEMSCQSCHQHAKGWSNGEAFSTKVNGKQNTRNSPTMYNVGYQTKYYWDGRAPSMEANILAAWKGHMGGDPDAMGKKLAGIKGYADQFQEAFGGEPNGDRIVKALATFVRTLRSGGSDFDLKKMSDQAKAGYEAYKKRCAACHLDNGLFTDLGFHNVGIGMDKAEPDVGRNKHDKEFAIGSFKTPTLRSVTKSGPYFHDGSVSDLREAVSIMANGGIANEHIDPTLKSLRAAHGEPTDEEIDNLVAFLKALESKESFEAPTLPE